MIKRISNYFHLIILPLIFFLTTRSDLLTGNISGISNNIYYYLLTILLGLAISILYFDLICKTLNKMSAIVFTFAIVSITSFPYLGNALIINIHILIGYISFCLVNLIIYKIIKKINDSKIEKLFLYSLILIALLFAATLAINNLIEMIYLTGIYFIALSIKRSLSSN